MRAALYPASASSQAPRARASSARWRSGLKAGSDGGADRGSREEGAGEGVTGAAGGVPVDGTRT